MKSEICQIIYNGEVTSGIFEMVLVSRNIADSALPGQFVHIKVNAGLYPLLRRPISINSVDKDKGAITILYHVVGQGTEELSKLEAGSYIDVMGPLGNGFPIFKDKRCAVVGGGIGTAPLLELAKNMQNCNAYLGFRDCVYKIEEFERHCDKVYITTEDGSIGYKGYITEHLLKDIARYDIVYTCGPKAMMQKTIEICQQNNVDCYVSIEERMGCGIGACLVCACKVKDENGQWHHKKACKDGPVFNAREVILDA